MRSVRLPRARRRKRSRRRRERVYPRPAPRRPRADPLLPGHALKPGRPGVPIFADLLGLYGRGDRAPWPMGGLVDGPRARVQVQPVGRLRLRSAAGPARSARVLGPPLALRSLAFAWRVRGREPCLSRFRPLWTGAVPKPALERFDPWPSRAGPPHLRLASKAAVSSSSRRATTTRSAPASLRARHARSRPPARPTIS